MTINTGVIFCCTATGTYSTQRKADDGRSPVGHETKEKTQRRFGFGIYTALHNLSLSVHAQLYLYRMTEDLEVRTDGDLFVHTHDHASSVSLVLWRLTLHATIGVPWLLIDPFRSEQLLPK